jgi:hypothetical protein
MRNTKNGNKITLHLTYRLPEYLNTRYYNEAEFTHNIVSGYSATVRRVQSTNRLGPHIRIGARAGHTVPGLRCRRGIFFFHCRNIIHHYTHMYCYLLLFFHYHLIMTCWSGYHTQNFGPFYRCYYYCYCKL